MVRREMMAYIGYYEGGLEKASKVLLNGRLDIAGLLTRTDPVWMR